MHPSRNDIGAYINPTLALQPTTVTSGTASDIAGEKIDRQGYQSGTLHACVGTMADGSAQDHQLLLEESADNTTFTPVTDVTIPAITADKGEIDLDIDFAARQRYLRFAYDASESSMTDDGGTATNIISAVLILGGADELPV